MFQNLLVITADQDIVPFDKNTFKVRRILVEKRQRTLLNQRIKTYHKLVPKSLLIFLPFAISERSLEDQQLYYLQIKRTAL